MNKKHKLLTTLSVLALSLTAVGTAFSANSLVQMDVKKASPDTVDLTLYTSQQNNGSAIVRKKSDNKYVVLVPGITSSAISTPDFHAAKDVITNVNVKSVNDTSDGYTKVTVITKKPLKIRTKTVTSAPITPEQKEYRTLLAVANTPKPNSINPIVHSTNSTASETKQSSQKPTVTKKTNTVTPQVVNNKKIEILNTPETKKTTVQKPTTKAQTTVQQQVPQKTLVEEKPKTFAQELKIDIVNNEKQAKTDKKDKSTGFKPIHLEDISVTVNNVTLIDKIKNKWNNEILPMIPAQVPVPLAVTVIPLLGLIFMFKLIKASIEKSRDLRAAFVNKVKSDTKITKRYADITNDDSLSWREKYQKYNDAVQNPEKYQQERLEKAKQTKYEFIKSQSIEEKRDNLEKMISPIEEQTNNMVNPNIVSSEDDVIANKMKSTVHLKGFANAPTLKAINREQFNNEIDFSQDIDSFAEQQKIMPTRLDISQRQQKDSNLGVFDVTPHSKSLKDAKRQEELRRKDYEMSSLEEYLSMIDRPAVNKEEILNGNSIKMISTPGQKRSTNEIKENVANLESTIKVPRPYQMASGMNLSKAFQNPFSKNNREIKMISTPKEQSPIEGLTVNAKTSVNENLEFMTVSINGKSALIGRSNDEITVLKEFSQVVDKPIQVRKDKENVYLVKTEGFKSLVEINEDKMGVLIEL